MEPNKTGEFDLSVASDQPHHQALKQLLARGLQNLKGLATMWGCACGHFRTSFGKAVVALDLTLIHPVLHGLRQGGPSNFLANNFRYNRHARLNPQAQSIPLTLRRDLETRVSEFEESLRTLFDQQLGEAIRSVSYWNFSVGPATCQARFAALGYQ